MRRETSERGGVNLALIITPMLDMAFQMLAFFVMTYHPSALEGHFEVKLLPPEKVALKGPAAAAKMELPSSDEEPTLTDVVLLTVKAAGKSDNQREDGQPRQILLKRPEATAPQVVANVDDALGEKEPQDMKGPFFRKLRAELKKVAAESTTLTADIKIEADPELKHMYTMEIYGLCRQAGFQRISFVAPAVLREAQKKE